MKKSIFLALILLIGSAALTSCSSKQSQADEPAISGSAGDSASDSANLGSASSGQGR